MFGIARAYPRPIAAPWFHVRDARRGRTRSVPSPGDAGAVAGDAPAAVVGSRRARGRAHRAPDGAPARRAADLGLLLHRGREDLLLAGAERALPQLARGVLLRLPAHGPARDRDDGDLGPAGGRPARP